ncbi:MAG TPA: hypothetical protein VGN72_15655 [Tepidisphaeraceae bacterium]|nr:hypothetical protein [Tepidisphaeraceae bacterium]
MTTTTNINFIITDPLVPMSEVEQTLHLARLAVESLHARTAWPSRPSARSTMRHARA